MTKSRVKLIGSIEDLFDEQFNGYNKAQVDGYVKSLSAAYQTAYESYNDLYSKYKDMREKHKSTEEMSDIRISLETIPAAPANPKILAQNAIEEIKAEMERIDLMMEAMRRG